MVESIANGLRPHLGKPFAFFGHSMGAIISFELARLLRRENGLLFEHPTVEGLAAELCRLRGCGGAGADAEWARPRRRG